MAEDNDDDDSGGGDKGGGSSGDAKCKCDPCPAGAPLWILTYSDSVTLILTFFILLYSFSKTETSKMQAALGSIRNQFGGAQGQVFQLGKSPDDAITVMDGAEPPKPFPIEFLTNEGLLDRHEINRESADDLKKVKKLLSDYGLNDSSDVSEMREFIKVRLNERIIFKEGSTEIQQINANEFKNIVKMLTENDWNVFVEGHSSFGEKGKDGQDAYALSASRAMSVAKVLMKSGVSSSKISMVSYGDSRTSAYTKGQSGSNPESERYVDFLIQKNDLKASGKKAY